MVCTPRDGQIARARAVKISFPSMTWETILIYKFTRLPGNLKGKDKKNIGTSGSNSDISEPNHVFGRWYRAPIPRRFPVVTPQPLLSFPSPEGMKPTRSFNPFFSRHDDSDKLLSFCGQQTDSLQLGKRGSAVISYSWVRGTKMSMCLPILYAGFKLRRGS